MATLTFNRTNDNQIGQISFFDDKLYLLESGFEPQLLSPSLSMSFTDDFSTNEYSNRYLKNTIHQLYQKLYACGDEVKVVEYDTHDVEIINSVGDNDHFYDSDNNRISIGEEMTSPLILIHEVLHAIIALDHDQLGEHPLPIGECGSLNIHANGSPGMMMDVRSRLNMHFKVNELENIPEGQFYLPFQHGYLDAEAYCLAVNDRRRRADLARTTISASQISYIKNNSKKRKRLKSFDKEKFYRAKFKTEAILLCNIKGFGDKGMTVEKYIDINLKNVQK